MKSKFLDVLSIIGIFCELMFKCVTVIFIMYLFATMVETTLFQRIIIGIGGIMWVIKSVYNYLKGDLLKKKKEKING